MVLNKPLNYNCMQGCAIGEPRCQRQLTFISGQLEKLAFFTFQPFGSSQLFSDHILVYVIAFEWIRIYTDYYQSVPSTCKALKCNPGCCSFYSHLVSGAKNYTGCWRYRTSTSSCKIMKACLRLQLKVEFKIADATAPCCQRLCQFTKNGRHVASRLVRLSPEQGVRVYTLNGDIALCS